MPERFGAWELLGQASDPVVADVGAIDDRLAYFRALTESIHAEGRRLGAIASGESLKGEFANELRSGAGEVARDLTQVVGRYDAVVGALTVYRPELDLALNGSIAALDDAMDADRALSSATEAAEKDSAAARLAAAKTRLTGVLSRYDQAGRDAAARVRGAFNDGLKDTGWDRFKHALIKILKIVVKVLTYIGMALAVIALFIPGIGQLVMIAGAVIGASVLAADIALKAVGEGSWVDIGLGIAGLLTFGAAKFVAPLASTFRPAMTATKNWGAAGWNATKSWGGTAWSSAKNRGGAAWTSAKDTVGRWRGPRAPATPDVIPDRLGVDIPMDRFTSYNRTDAEVLEEYTGSAYLRMNSFTRRGSIRDPQMGINTAADIAAAERALDALPPFVGVTTRGTSLPRKTFDDFREGNTITTDSLWSSTTDPRVAENFGYGNGVDTVLTINGKSGRQLTDVSLIASEKEVLFKPWTRFHVDDKRQDPATERWYITLTEV